MFFVLLFSLFSTIGCFIARRKVSNKTARLVLLILGILFCALTIYLALPRTTYDGRYDNVYGTQMLTFVNKT